MFKETAPIDFLFFIISTTCFGPKLKSFEYLLSSARGQSKGSIIVANDWVPKNKSIFNCPIGEDLLLSPWPINAN